MFVATTPSRHKPCCGYQRGAARRTTVSGEVRSRFHAHERTLPTARTDRHTSFGFVLTALICAHARTHVRNRRMMSTNRTTMRAEKTMLPLAAAFAVFAFSAFASDAPQEHVLPRHGQPVGTAASVNRPTEQSSASSAGARAVGDEVLNRAPVAVNQPPATPRPADEPPSCIFQRRTRAKRVLIRMLAELARAAAQ